MCDPDELAAAKLFEEYLEDTDTNLAELLNRCPVAERMGLEEAIRGALFARQNYAPLLVSEELVDRTMARIRTARGSQIDDTAS